MAAVLNHSRPGLEAWGSSRVGDPHELASALVHRQPPASPLRGGSGTTELAASVRRS